MTNTAENKKLQNSLSQFVQERDWEQYHSPKNLAMALSVECSELVEIFQWMTAEQSYLPDTQTIMQIEEEIGDIMIYLCMIGLKFDIDPYQAAFSKLEKNKLKYPPLPQE